MSGKLAGKVAVVTGGSAGIGLEAAKRFAQEGARVFITGRDRARLDRAVAEIGDGTIGVQGDVSKLSDIDRIYSVVKESAEHIDVLFVNAGI
jgi:NAD(P)-dependent dehydrogenase (short-subunit alcohol dehydrogenase family)